MTDKQFNMIESVFYYMWNTWTEDECRNVKWHHTASHFWEKWSYYYHQYGASGAIAPFLSALDDSNRRALYERAITLYDGKSRHKLDIEEVLDCDIYSIYLDNNNEKQIKIQGYFYFSGGPYEDESKPYRLVEYCWAEVPLKKFIKNYKNNTDKREEFLSECKQYIGDLSQKEASKNLAHYFGELVLGGKMESHAPTPLLYSVITLDTPCGDYINFSF